MPDFVPDDEISPYQLVPFVIFHIGEDRMRGAGHQEGREKIASGAVDSIRKFRINPLGKAMEVAGLKNRNVRLVLQHSVTECFQGVVRQVVIGIQKQDIFSPGFLHSPVPSRSLTEIFLIPDNSEAGVAADKFSGGRDAVVIPAVVDQNHFQGREFLLLHTFQTAHNVMFHVEYRDDDGNERFHTGIIDFTCRQHAATLSPGNSGGGYFKLVHFLHYIPIEAVCKCSPKTFFFFYRQVREKNPGRRG